MCAISKPYSREDLKKYVLTAAAIAAAISCSDECLHNEGTRKGCPTIPRQRKTVEEIFSNLGPACSKRAYRMRTDSFYKLHYLLCGTNPSCNKRKRGVASNSDIASKTKLIMALRFLPVEIIMTLEVMMALMQTLFAMSHGKLWTVLMAVNLCRSNFLTTKVKN